jgi:hypothetical protein
MFRIDESIRVHIDRIIKVIETAGQDEEHEVLAELDAEITRFCQWWSERHPQPVVATHAVLTIKGATSMASNINVDSTTATLSLSFVDDRGDVATAPAGATVAYASDNAAVATVDATSGKIVGVLAGTFNASATVTNADGTPTLEPDGVTDFSPAPVNVTVDPGAAASDVFTVTP